MKYKKIGKTGFVVSDYDTHFVINRDILNQVGYQHHAVKHAIHWCKQRRVALDIGAHIGLITKQLLPLFKKIHTFEPCLENFDCLIQNIPEGYVYHHNVAISDQHEINISLFKHKCNSGAHTLTTQLGETKSGTEQVTAVTLDNYEFKAVDFIKIDAQGSELKILKGGDALIKGCKPTILIEDCEGKNELLAGLEDDSEVQTYMRDWLGMTYRIRVGKDVIYSYKD